ncbi:MAG: HAMP domain-containing histidine kinase [Odoribacteraceae bacterium]|jgi:signal transduction histidine kinase|nr:HAMP domain-containing histidine kinase [Odoribacteraceae bacterium]
MRRIVIAFALAAACAAVASLWEEVFAPRSDRQRLEAFERGLHREERWADELLAELRGEREPHWMPWKFKGFSLLCFKEGRLVYWNNERVGTPSLYETLRDGGRVVRLNNAYYESRRRSEGDMDYFALIFIQDDYPHANRYVKNRVNPALGSSRVRVLANDEAGEGVLLRDRRGAPLFRVDEAVEEVDRGSNFLVLSLYALALFLLFRAYKLLLAGASTTRGKLARAASFLAFILLLYCATRYFKAPHSLYHLALLPSRVTSWSLARPVGDLFISIFCAVHFFFITFQYLQPGRLAERYRTAFAFSLLLLIFAYINLFASSIDSLIVNTQVSLNIARIMSADVSSIAAFVTLMIGAMGVLVLMDGSARHFARLFRPGEVAARVAISWGCFAAACELLELTVAWRDCLFALLLQGVLLLNAYAVKGEARKSVFLVAIALVAAYIMGIARESEMQREWAVRAGYANEIISERDASFEEKLLEVDQKARHSSVLDSLARRGDREALSSYLLERLADLTGYHYAGTIRFPAAAGWDSLIDRAGVPVAGSSFYNIDDFDGFTTYIGRFRFPSAGDSACLYLRFDSKLERDRPGYLQILSREPSRPVSGIYPYSHAKYRDGKLLHAHGDYNYSRTITSRPSHVQAADMNGYTHMMIPVGPSGLFIISLGKGFFAPYGLNVLYAILACLLFSSYGVFFQAGARVRWPRRVTIERRVRDSIIALVCGLLLVSAWISIMTISAGYERRQSLEALRLLKFVNRELEQLDQVEANGWPGVTSVLERVADAIQVDVNIYSMEGQLAATSLPLIFERGLDGMLLNPEAHRRVVREQANSFVQEERVGELSYMAVYMPLELANGKRYVLSIPYFAKSDELNRDIFFLVIISISAAISAIILSLSLSRVVAERIVRPLRVVNERLRLTRLDGKNEKITYRGQDEVATLVKEYNDMVDKLDESARQLSRAQRETAWREMARQIAHEIKNPLTPMKLNIQFLQRALEGNNPEKARARLEDVSTALIEQIDHMAAIAGSFADFAKIPETTNEWFNFSEMVTGRARLFAGEVSWMTTEIEQNVSLFGDKEQVNRVLVNLLKNAAQSIPPGRQGEITVTLERRDGLLILQIKDNGAGIPEETRARVAEPNFTTKSGGMGLGLPIAYRVVEGMGGSIRFESEVGVGTTFIVTFKETFPPT